MMQCDDNNVDDEGTCNTLEHFTEYEQVLQLLESIKAIDAAGFEKDFELFTEILSRYQEQPHLLDPHLEELLQRLLGKVRSDASAAPNVMHAAFKYLYIICKVRTYKTLVKFLPHELPDLEFALDLLERQDDKDHLNWETRYMLILWMSILVLNPFHLARLDAYETPELPNGDGDVTGDHAPASSSNMIITNHEQRKTKMERIFDLCKQYTTANDTCSNIAAYLSAKYFVRSDIKDLYLERFLDWIISQHNATTFEVHFGQLAAVSAILKHGKREDLLPYANKLLQWIVSCQYKDSANFLKYKNYIKIIQRIGLVFLKPRVAKWRYKRGTRSLATNLTQVQNSQSTQQTVGDSMDIGQVDDDEDDEIEIPDAIEEVIEELLQALRSGGSDIRWNAAKGIGRVTNRLPKEMADEVIGSVIDILSPLEPHDAWHGGCLALAELAKRGLLLPYRLSELVPLLLQALFYDEMKGYMSVGMNIRDAACYMCWAFARAYNPNDLQPFVQEISAALLIVAVFDREINCRRAASAAFQESVGRLGNFPHGIEINTTVDFFAVGLRQNSYLVLSDFIASFPAYARPLIDHLVDRKVNHWDVAIRELTAKALNKLTHRDAEYMGSIVLSKLFAKTNSIDINTRHGSVLAIGEITLALRQLELAEGDEKRRLLSKQVLTDLNELLGRFLVRDLFRGMSGEMMKQCCADYIKNCSLARIETNEQCLESWQEIIDKCLINKTAVIRECATAAFAELSRAYYVGPERSASNANIINNYLKGADNDLEEHIRMGFISALGVLPREMIVTQLEPILDSLVKHSLTPLQAMIGGEANVHEHENVQTYKWSEARRDSVKALANLVQTIGYEEGQAASFANSKHFNKVMECLLRALDEYTLDNRGDIGAWVREAAMNAIYQLITTCPKSLLNPEHVHSIISRFLQQSVEKIDRTRGLAGRLFCNLIHCSPPIPHIKHHSRLLEIFPEDANSVLWLFADHTFPLFCNLLELPEYSKRVLLGLSASIGQLTESLIKYASSAMFQFLRSHPAEVPRLCAEIVENFEENLLNERVTYPLLSFLDTLMGSGTVNAVLADETNSFPEDIYRLVNLEIKGYKKLYKLTSSIGVYCQLLQVPRLSKRILSKMAIFLGLQHVHVRKTTSTKFYEALALHGDTLEDISEEQLDEILNLLTETDWGLPLVEVRPVRNELCRLMGIKAPVSGLAAAAGGAAPVKAN